MAFPWTTLITAVSTLSAALGGVGVKERGDRRERKAEAGRREVLGRIERRRIAYADLITIASARHRDLGHLVMLRSQSTSDHKDVVAYKLRIAESNNEFARALSMVQLVGSESARVASRTLSTAMNNAEQVVVWEPEFDAHETTVKVGAVRPAIDGFLDAVRPETAN